MLYGSVNVGDMKKPLAGKSPTDKNVAKNEEKRQSAIIFARKLKRLIDESRFSQKELGAMIGRSQSKISYMLREDVEVVITPTRSELVRLAEVFGVSLEYLCDDRIAEPGETRSVRVPLAPKYQKMLDLVEEMGVDLAYRRLLQIDSR